jgi:signal transduction histidine kinase
MSKIKKVGQKTKANMKLVLDNLEETIDRRMKLIEKYNETGDAEKMRIARALEDNVGMLITMKTDMIALEKNSEKEIFGD